ncbi:MAG: hypothetical protein JRI47_02245 [Deltaproteobacteria bacterium]|nr:hypothetical protein [Deltaproteobacteria bacterium]
MNKGDIAAVGMFCVFPGAGDLPQFWHNLVNGDDLGSKTGEQ